MRRCSTGLGTVHRGFRRRPGRPTIPSVGSLRLLWGGEGVACIHRHPAHPLRGSDARSILSDAILHPRRKPSSSAWPDGSDCARRRASLCSIPSPPSMASSKLNLAVGVGCLLVVGADEAFLLWRWFLCRRAKLIWWAALASSSWQGSRGPGCAGRLQAGDDCPAGSIMGSGKSMAWLDADRCPVSWAGAQPPWPRIFHADQMRLPGWCDTVDTEQPAQIGMRVGGTTYPSALHPALVPVASLRQAGSGVACAAHCVSMLCRIQQRRA